MHDTVLHRYHNPRTVSLGFDVTPISGGHMMADMGRLSFCDIITHRNLALNGFRPARIRSGWSR